MPNVETVRTLFTCAFRKMTGRKLSSDHIATKPSESLRQAKASEPIQGVHEV